jgi:hypothetical protein
MRFFDRLLRRGLQLRFTMVKRIAQARLSGGEIYLDGAHTASAGGGIFLTNRTH